MGGIRRIAVGVFAIALGLVAGSLPAAADTYTVSSYPYATDAMIGAEELWDSHQITAAVGKEIKYSVRATSGGCVLGALGLGHNWNEESFILPAYSQETCVPSFSKTYKVPSGGGPDFSIIVSSELIEDVPYHLDISVADPSPLSVVAGIVGFVILVAIIGGIGAAVRRRRRAAPPPVTYPPPYAPGAPAQYPPPGPAQPPTEPVSPPQYPPPP